MPAGAEASKPRAVLDSNVLISGFAFPGGTPHHVLQALVRGEITAVVSPHILGEVEQVLRGKLAVPEPMVRDAIGLLRERCELVDPTATAAVADLSPDDNRVLDCAVAGKAEYLITGDRGIQRLRDFEGIAIVSPIEFVEAVLRLGGGPSE